MQRMPCPVPRRHDTVAGLPDGHRVGHEWYQHEATQINGMVHERAVHATIDEMKLETLLMHGTKIIPANKLFVYIAETARTDRVWG